jgi:hypothetical protein
MQSCWYIFVCKTAILAKIHHAPIENEKERYVFYAMPHIAIDNDGQLGRCRGKKIQLHAVH